MNFKKRNYYLILGIISLIIVPIIISIIVNSIYSHKLEKSNQILNESLDLSDYSLCYKISYQEIRDRCFFELGTKINNSNLCSEIKKDSTKNDCYYAVSINIRDIELCNKITKEKRRYVPIMLYPSITTSKKDRCQEEVEKALIDDAVKSKDYKNCKDNQECEYRIALLLNDYEHCKQLTNFNSCYSDIASNFNDTKICYMINESGTKGDCIFRVAKNLMNYKLCNEISDKDKIKECLDYFYCNDKDKLCFPNDNLEYREMIKSIVENGTLNQCDNLPQLSKEFCYLEFAIKNKDISLCKNLKYGWEGWNHLMYNLSQECSLSVAILSKNLDLCEEAGRKYKVACMQQILNDLGEINISKKVSIREDVFNNKDVYGNVAHYHVQNTGDTYLLSNNFHVLVYQLPHSKGCYRPGVIMPGSFCTVSIFEKVDSGMRVSVRYENITVVND